MGLHPDNALQIVNQGIANRQVEQDKGLRNARQRNTQARQGIEDRRQQQRSAARRRRRGGANEAELLEIFMQQAAEQGLLDANGELTDEGIAQLRRERGQLLNEAGNVGRLNDRRHEQQGLRVVNNNALVRGMDANVIGEDQADLQNVGGFDVGVGKGGIRDAEKAIEEQDKAALRANERVEEPFIQFGEPGRPDLGTLEGQAEYKRMLMYPQDGRKPLNSYDANNRIGNLIKAGIYDPIGEEGKNRDFKIFAEQVDRPYRDRKGRQGRRIAKEGLGPGFVKGKAWNFRWDGEGPDPDRRDAEGNVVGAKGEFVVDPNGVQRRDMQARQRVDLEPGGGGRMINPVDAIRQALAEGRLQLDQPITPEMLGGLGGGEGNGRTVGELLARLEKDQPVQFDAEGRPGLLNAEGNRIAAPPAMVERNRMQQLAAAMVQADERAAAGILPQSVIDRRMDQLQGLIDFPQRAKLVGPGGEFLMKNEEEVVPRLHAVDKYANPKDDPLFNLRRQREAKILTDTADLQMRMEELPERRKAVYGDALLQAEILRRNVGTDSDINYGYIPSQQSVMDLNRVPMAEPVYDLDGNIVDFADRRGNGLSTEEIPMPEVSELRKDTANWIGSHLESEYDAARKQRAGLPPNPNLAETPVVATLANVSQRFRDAGVALDRDIRSVDDFENAAMRLAQIKGIKPRVKKDFSGAVVEQRPFVGVEDVVFNMKLGFEQEHELARALYLSELANAQQGNPDIIGTNPQMRAAEAWREGGGYLKPEAEFFEKEREVGIQQIGRQNVPKRFAKKELGIAKERAQREAEARALARGVAPGQAKLIGKQAAKQVGNLDQFGGPTRELAPRLRKLDPQNRILNARDELLEAISNPSMGINPNNELLPFLVDRGGNANIDLSSLEGRQRLKEEVAGLAEVRLGMFLDEDQQWLDQARGRLIGAAADDVQAGGRRAADGLLIANGPRFGQDARAAFARDFRRAAAGLPVDAGAADVPYGNQPVLGNQQFRGAMTQGMTPQQLGQAERQLAQWGRGLQQQPVIDPRMAARNLGLGGNRPYQEPLLGGFQAPMRDGGVERLPANFGNIGVPFINEAQVPAMQGMNAFEADMNRVGGAQREAFAQNAVRQALVPAPAQSFSSAAFRTNPNGEPMVQRAGRDFVRVFDKPNESDRKLVRAPQNANPPKRRAKSANASIAEQAAKRKEPVRGQMDSKDPLIKALDRTPVQGPRRAPNVSPTFNPPAPQDYTPMPFGGLQRAPMGQPVGRAADPVTRSATQPTAQSMQTQMAQTVPSMERVDAPTPATRDEQTIQQEVRRRKGTQMRPEAQAEQKARGFGQQVMDAMNRARGSKRGRMYGGIAAGAGATAGLVGIGSAISNEREKRKEEEREAVIASLSR